MTTQYGSTDFNRIKTFKVKPLNKVVKVDHYLLECPVNKYEFLDFVKYVLIGGTPKHNNIPVCQQCKSNGYRCILVEDGVPCMGPVIQAGCNALCPGHSMPCDGCRGSTMQAAYQQHVDLLFEKGCSKEDITRLLLKYNGEDEQLRKFIQEKWSQQDKKLKYVEE
jgi:coenzyme F420-reducing hydrogenase gamma subunit